MSAHPLLRRVGVPSWATTSTARGVTVVGLFAFVIAAVSTLLRGGFPPAHVHDEFSYLLAADTFASGRLANPAHALSAFFETYHVLSQPAYVSKYPPGQGLFLALGQVLTGEPIVGVWLSYGLMCAAFTWMLYAFTRPRWAVGGGAFAAFYLIGVQADLGSWASGYWGGAVAAMGGAMLLGAIGRVITNPSMVTGITMATGVGILANSRPFEGLLVSIPPAIAFFAWLLRDRRSTIGWRLSRVALPATMTLSLFLVAMGVYNRAITGSPLRLPYAVYESARGSSSIFLLGKPRVHTYSSEEMARFYRGQPVAPATPVEMVRALKSNLDIYQAFYAPFFLCPLLFLFPAVIRDKKNRLAAACVAVVTVGLFSETWGAGHYAAPMAGALLVLYAAAARRLSLLRIRRDMSGRTMLHVGLVCIVVSAAVYPPFRFVMQERYRNKWWGQREQFIDRLTAMGGKHLIVVSYDPKHDPNEEFVSNRADIDASTVVWARSLGARDSLLLKYYRDRRVWKLHVEPDRVPLVLQPLDPSS